ncbi:unnamed protein product [Mortierella alpina]
MSTLATSCPQLSWLKLSSHSETPWSPQCLHFPAMQQRFTVLSLSLYNDNQNMVIPAILAHSAATIRELYFENARWHTDRDVPRILRSCPKLRILRVNAFFSTTGQPMASTPLPYLVEQPWVCTHLRELSLAVTDVREPSLDLAVEEVEREKLARLVLRLYHQIQELKEFSPFCSLRFFGLSFIMMPLEAGLRYMDWRMTVDDLRGLGLWWQPTESDRELA